LQQTRYSFEEENINNIYGTRNYAATIRLLSKVLFRHKRGKVTGPGENCIMRGFICVLLNEYYWRDEMGGICGTKGK
jgi:hypothetical protein